MAFYLLGIPGLVWALSWLIWFRDYPERRIVGDADAVSPIPLPQVLRSRGMAKAMGQYFIGNFTFFICISWMLPYLAEQYSLTPSQAAHFSMVPLLFGAVANWVSGFFVDLLYRSRYRSWSRRAPATLGFLLAASGVYAVILVDSPGAAVAAFAVATFGVELTISPSWAYCIDIGCKNSGSVSAAMNMAGSFGAFASANAFPWLYRLTGDSGTYFRIAAGLNALAILCWFSMRSNHSLEPAQALEKAKAAFNPPKDQFPIQNGEIRNKRHSAQLRHARATTMLTSINSFVMAYYRKLLIWFSPHYLAFATRRGHNVSITLFRCLRLLPSVRMAPSSIFYPCARHGRSRIKNTPGWFRPSPTPFTGVSSGVSSVWDLVRCGASQCVLQQSPRPDWRGFTSAMQNHALWCRSSKKDFESAASASSAIPAKINAKALL